MRWYNEACPSFACDTRPPVMSESDSPLDTGDIFEALCVGQSEQEIIDDLVSKGWSRDEASNVVRALNEKVTEFIEAERNSHVPEALPAEEPMKSFRPYKGKPVAELGAILGKLAGLIIVLGLMALLAYSSCTM